MNEYAEYLIEGNGYVPVTNWGQDHWSTFAYLETRAVDGKGAIDNPRMRCNARLHREFANMGPFGNLHDGAKYPTLLAGGIKLEKHDDWSCLEDMVAAGLIKAFYRRKSHTDAFGHAEARVEIRRIGETAMSLTAGQRAALERSEGKCEYSEFWYSECDTPGSATHHVFGRGRSDDPSHILCMTHFLHNCYHMNLLDHHGELVTKERCIAVVSALYDDWVGLDETISRRQHGKH